MALPGEHEALGGLLSDPAVLDSQVFRRSQRPWLPWVASLPGAPWTPGGPMALRCPGSRGPCSRFCPEGLCVCVCVCVCVYVCVCVFARINQIHNNLHCMYVYMCRVCVYECLYMYAYICARVGMYCYCLGFQELWRFQGVRPLIHGLPS